MRRLVPFAVVAALSSLATAAVVVLPALAEGDGGRTYSLHGADRPFAFDLGRFAACMRDRGFDLGGDVEIRVDGDRVTVDGKEVDGDRFRAAETACGGPPFRGLGDLPPMRGLPPLRGLPPDELREQRDAFLGDVARRLGVDADRLKQALREAAVARVDALEREGKIGEEEADALRELARSGGLPFPHGPVLGLGRRWPVPEPSADLERELLPS